TCGVSEDAILALRKDTTLDPAAREVALRVAAVLGDDPIALNNAAWTVVVSPGADAAAYRLAARRAQAAARLHPGDGMMLHTLRVARSRAGDSQGALAALDDSTRINAASGKPSPADLAFQAMALWQLDRHDQARAALQQLRDRMRQGGAADS